MGDMEGIAHIVAVNMGYGHERAMDALRWLSVDGGVLVANDYPGIPARDKAIWETTRTWYERVSRFASVPVVGKWVFGIWDEIQRIPEFYPRRDLSRPILPLMELYALLRNQGWCRDLIARLARDPRPLITSYFAVAFAAEEFAYPGEIYLTLCDADISRGWAPLDPAQSRIKYFAPTGRAVERLKAYGVPKENIFFTGFPLPLETIGGVKASVLRKDLARRLCALDPRGIFTAHAEGAITAKLGTRFCGGLAKRTRMPLHVAFAVGGAGAQQHIAADALVSMRQRLLEGAVRLTLVAGARSDVATYFQRMSMRHGLAQALQKGNLRILLAHDRAEYFARFTSMLRETDVLWTKPSELSFVTGLGIPIVMAPPVGSQERCNRQWLLQVGGGTDQLDPRYVNEWLCDWVNNGSLARLAWNGFAEAPTHGAYRIEDVVRGRPNTMHELPLVI